MVETVKCDQSRGVYGLRVCVGGGVRVCTPCERSQWREGFQSSICDKHHFVPGPILGAGDLAVKKIERHLGWKDSQFSS